MDKALAETIGEDFEKQLAEYTRLTSEREAIHDRLQKAQNERDFVKAHIFQRVASEYEAQMQVLDDSMQPLSEVIETVATRLSNELVTIEERISGAEDRMEELLFRHRVGEFPDDELTRKQDPLQSELNELTERRTTIQSKLQDIIAVSGPEPTAETTAETTNQTTDRATDETTETATAASPPASTEAHASDSFPDRAETPAEGTPASEPATTTTTDDTPATVETPQTDPASAEPVNLAELAEPIADDNTTPNNGNGQGGDDAAIETPSVSPAADTGTTTPAQPATPAPSPVAVADARLNDLAQNLVDPTDWVDELIDPADTPTPQNDPAFAAMANTATGTPATPTTAENADPERREASPENYPVLMITKGPGSGRKLPLLPMTMTMGREHDNNIEIKDEDVARYHARISFQRGKYLLEDLESASGTWVNDVRIGETTLAHGDQIRVGSTEMTIAFSTSGPISAS